MSEEIQHSKEVIEVTPEMVQAGWDVLAASHVADDLLEADKLTVERVYLAMAHLDPSRRQAHGAK